VDKIASKTNSFNDKSKVDTIKKEKEKNKSSNVNKTIENTNTQTVSSVDKGQIQKASHKYSYSHGFDSFNLNHTINDKELKDVEVMITDYLDSGTATKKI